MFKYLFIAVFLLFSSPAYANTYLNWGIGFDYPISDQYSDVQNYALGTQRKLSNKFDYILEGGGWKDGGHYPGATASLYGVGAVGIDLKMHEHYASYFIGPAILSSPDTILGNNFQIYHKLSIGVRDYRDERLGVFVKHFSDAGLSSVNYGRNFIGVEASF